MVIRGIKISCVKMWPQQGIILGLLLLKTLAQTDLQIEFDLLSNQCKTTASFLQNVHWYFARCKLVVINNLDVQNEIQDFSDHFIRQYFKGRFCKPYCKFKH